MQKSMGLKFEPASEPLPISLKSLNSRLESNKEEEEGQLGGFIVPEVGAD